MTILLNQAMEAAQKLPPDAQDEIARLLLAYAGRHEPDYELSADENAAIAASRAAA